MPFFQTDQARLHYYQFGTGQEVMLAFHGFGMRGTQFDVLQPALAERYTVYSFDLFFHGNSELGDPSVGRVRKGLSAAEYAAQIEAFIKTLGVEKVSLLAYSMGALMAFALVDQVPQRIKACFFIAPDGLRPNRLLEFGSRNLLVNRAFYRLVYSPATVAFILRQLLRFGYVDQALFRILQGEFKSEETRLTCYNAITYHARLRFEQERLAEKMNSHGMTSYFYFGRDDKLFPPSIGRDFSKRLKNTTLTVMETGHELVNEQLRELLIRQLNAND